MNRFTLELQAKDNELQELRQAHLALQTSTDAVKEELQSCKQDLFELVPLNQTPDTDIIRLYEQMSDQISNWIDEERFQFEELKSQQAGNSMNFISDGGNYEAAKVLREFPEADEYLVLSAIYAFLQEKVLGENVYYVGMGEATRNFLRRIENHMAILKPPRGQNVRQATFKELQLILSGTIKIDHWRSETLKAFAIMPSTVNEEETQLQDITINLFKILRPMLPIFRTSRASLVRLNNQVIQPAAKLASVIQLSSVCYEFRPQIPSVPLLENKTAFVADLNRFTLIDVSTGRPLKPDSPVDVKKDGEIGRLILMVEPSLHRVNKHTKHEIELRRAVYLVQLASPLR
ncbi:MAG: hypothetical protein Q9187_006758 [Circinaria calcarea]